MSKHFLLAALAALAVPCAHAGDDDWNLHLQATRVWQQQAAFSAPYTGAYSLRPQAAQGQSLSATASAGLRLGPETEVYLDAEAIGGRLLSELHGLGGLSNGEQTKAGASGITLYRARAYLRQQWALSETREAVADDVHQLAGSQATRRLVLTAGNLSAADLFDNNRYAHDPRSAFLNAALMANGAWDYPADARGYSWGAALEYVDGKRVWRIGRFAVPQESNGLPLDHALARHHADQAEFEQGYDWNGQAGNLRVLVFRNRARMGAFADALASQPGAPDLASVRREQIKRGLGLSWDQDLSAALGLFARLGSSDGHTETYSFAEIEQSASAGLVLRGAGWGRADDRLGLGGARNGLHAAHRAYLGAGGHGAFLGDGRLRYASEQIADAWYSAALAPGLDLSLDLQRIVHPGYNAERGPVRLAALRLHLQR
ncbi:carbohydrate porin [Massilia sp. TS11]|uniref:carbohydrate porin n=1 Tax=Massilia sp. TS11 TaxID=2908003 RepID=UPI001EDBA1C5|nr:carbohydrate porin [Massilia sp. TS11]MCG2585014.1 carbohydrate porin [Massilia sp. TS11]